jgi:hypothetical protein
MRETADVSLGMPLARQDSMSSLSFRNCCAGGTALALALLPMAGCKAKLAEQLPAPASHAAAEQNAAPRSDTNASIPPAPGAPGERPSVTENMGRGFQGKLAMRLQNAAGARHDLRYSSLGNTARLQIDAVDEPQPAASPLHFDALIWGESISVLDHQRRTVRTLPLRQIRPSEQPSSDVELHDTGERTSIQGVFCQLYRIRQGPLQVDTCVGGLPGDFAVDKFESVSGIVVPPWAEQLLKRELLPLRALARDAQGRELYRLELVEYSSGPVDRALLAVPPDYQVISAGLDTPQTNTLAAEPPRTPAPAQGASPGGQP